MFLAGAGADFLMFRLFTAIKKAFEAEYRLRKKILPRGGGILKPGASKKKEPAPEHDATLLLPIQGRGFYSLDIFVIDR